MVKKNLTSLRWFVEVKDGKILAPSKAISKEVAALNDCPRATLTLKVEGKEKTHAQMRVFHGPIIEQVQSFIMATEGLYKSVDRIKYELKEMFLIKRKRYWDDGSPVIIKIKHPTREGVFMEWHFEEVPSLSELTVDQARSFIDHILDYYLHEKGLHIEIDPELASYKYST